MELVYILHFDKKLHHAGHYVGRSRPDTIKRRINDHRAGIASNLTHWVVETGLIMHVGGIYQVDGNAGEIERKLKRKKATPLYCSLCTDSPRRLKGAIPISLELIPFAEG